MIRNCSVSLHSSRDRLESGQRIDTEETKLLEGVAYISRPNRNEQQFGLGENRIDAVLHVHSAMPLLEVRYATVKNHVLANTYEVLNTSVTNHEWTFVLQRRAVQ
jgi:hemoglobin-like flavoprotein